MYKFKLTGNMECFCGSGKEFKFCCQDLLTISSLKNLSTEIEKGDYKQAFLFCKAEIVRYMINVKRHTEGLLVRNPLYGNKLLDIDIKALSELLEKMIIIISKANLQIPFIDMLNRLEELLDNGKWHTRILYYKVMWEYLYNNNLVNAKKYLTNISFSEINDLDFLQLYLDIMGDELPFSNKVEIIDRLIKMETKISGKIKYLGAKSIEFLLIGDTAEAKNIIKQAIEIANNNSDKVKESYDIYQYGNVYILGGKLLEDTHLKQRSGTYFESMLSDNSLTVSGKAMVYSHLGDVYFSLNDFEKAFEFYNQSLKLEDLHLTRILIADIYFHKSDFNNSIKILKGIEYDTLTFENKIDFLIIYAKNLLSTVQNRTEVIWILEELKKLTLQSKYFSDIVNELIISIQELLVEKNNKKQRKSLIRKILSKLNEYLILQPNLMGFGVNINSLINDLVKEDNPNKRTKSKGI